MYFLTAGDEWLPGVAPQLGITREWLQKIDVGQLLTAEIERVLLDMKKCDAADDGCGLGAVEKVRNLFSIIMVSGASTETYRNATCCTLLQLRARLRDTMQSRSDATSAPTAGVHSSDSSYSKLYALYREGLQWAVSAHKRLHSALSTAAQRHQDQLTIAKTAAVEWLAAAQGLVDACFELCDASEDLSVQREALDTMEPVIAELLSLACGSPPTSANGGPTDRNHRTQRAGCGPVLYYQVKYLEFSAAYHRAAQQPRDELHTLEQALNVWTQLDALHYYGSGNAVADPHREEAAVLARLAQIHCIAVPNSEAGLGAEVRNSTNGQQMHSSVVGDAAHGLQYVLRSMRYTVQAWLPASLQLWAPEVLGADAVVVARADGAVVRGSALTSAEVVQELKKVPNKVLQILAEDCYIALQCLALAPINYGVMGSQAAPTLDLATLQPTEIQRMLSHLCTALSAQGHACDKALLDAVVEARTGGHDPQAGSPRPKPVLKRLKRKGH
jgi:hypothetical protein